MWVLTLSPPIRSIDIEYGSLAVARIVSSTDEYWHTPLHLAAWRGYIDVVTVLIDNHANTEAKNKRQERPIHLAARHGHAEVVKKLIESGSKNNDGSNGTESEECTPLHYAAVGGHKNVIETLLRKLPEIDINAKVRFVSNTERKNARAQGYTPLHAAAGNGCLDAVRYLVEHGANVDAKGIDDERTPLEFAESCSHVEVIQYLKDPGLNSGAGFAGRSVGRH
jgi:ankyrin repeat protein